MAGFAVHMLVYYLRRIRDTAKNYCKDEKTPKSMTMYHSRMINTLLCLLSDLQLYLLRTTSTLEKVTEVIDFAY